MKINKSPLRVGIFASTLVALVCGCAEVQNAYKGYQEREEMAYIASAKDSCARYGFTPGSDSFAQCVNANVNAAKDRDALKRAAFHGEK